MAPSSEWHLSKNVPIAIIIGFVIQTITFLMVGSYWVSQTDARLGQLERTADQIAAARAGELERLNRLDALVQVLGAQSGEIASRLNRIDDKLDRLMESRRSQVEGGRP